MLSSQTAAVAPLVIRDLSSPSELRSAETLQKDVWAITDRDVIPLAQFVAARAAGGVVVGAFDGATLAGFAYGFPSFDEDGPAMHSHLLAVRPAYRGCRVGRDLKLAQRERTLQKGLTRMTWTFDPLRPINAHLNFGRLGVVSDCYLRDFYGEESHSVLDRSGTDRLWVTWFLDSARVCARLGGMLPDVLQLPARARPLVEVASDGHPIVSPLLDLRTGLLAAADLFTIEIPGVGYLEDHADLNQQWRIATRTAFTRAIEAGCRVEEYLALPTGSALKGGRQTGVYLLVPPVGAISTLGSS